MTRGCSRFDVCAVVAVVAVVTAGWALGFPSPHVDDLFFTGTAVNLAHGGGLANPWIGPWLMKEFGTMTFWAQPPLHPLVLGAWLKLTGVGTAQILAFTALATATLALVSLIIVRQAGAGVVLSLGLVVATIQFTAGHGLRPDTPGLALTALAGWCWMRASLARWVAGCLCAGLAPMMHPFTVTIVVPLGLSFLFWHAKTLRLTRLLLGCGLAAIVVGAVFVWCLNGEIAGFWRVFTQCAKLRTPADGQRWVNFWHELKLGWEPMLKGPAYLGLVAIAVATWGQRRELTIRVLAVFLGFLALGIRLYAQYTPHYAAYLALWCAALLLAQESAGPRRRQLVLVWSACVLINLMPEALAVAVRRAESPAVYADLKATAGRFSGRLLIDEVATRYVYGFRLPANASDWLLGRTTDRWMDSPVRLKSADEAWLVDARKLELYSSDSGIKAEHARFAEREFSTIQVRPGEVHFVR